VCCRHLTRCAAGTRQANLPGGRRTGPPGKFIGNGHYVLQDDQVRVFVAPTVAELARTPLRAYVAAGVRLSREAVDGSQGIVLAGRDHGRVLYDRLVDEGAVAGAPEWYDLDGYDTPAVEATSSLRSWNTTAEPTARSSLNATAEATATPTPAAPAAANEGVARIEASTLPAPVTSAPVPVEVVKSATR
jgi:hypothetical protein